MNEFQQWAEVIKHIEAEQLGFDDGKTKVSSAQFVDDVNLVAQWIPETHLQNEKTFSVMTGRFRQERVEIFPL